MDHVLRSQSVPLVMHSCFQMMLVCCRSQYLVRYNMCNTRYFALVLFYLCCILIVFLNLKNRKQTTRTREMMNRLIFITTMRGELVSSSKILHRVSIPTFQMHSKMYLITTQMSPADLMLSIKMYV